MKLSDLRLPPGARHRKKRVGRGPGSGHGKTATRGHKGQRARTGSGLRPGFEGGRTPILRRVPKRGGRFHTWPMAPPVEIINLERLTTLVGTEDVTPQLLAERGWIKHPTSLVKILAKGSLARPLRVAAHRFSQQAIQKIQAAGGTVVHLPAHAGRRTSSVTPTQES